MKVAKSFDASPLEVNFANSEYRSCNSVQEKDNCSCFPSPHHHPPLSMLLF